MCQAHESIVIVRDDLSSFRDYRFGFRISSLLYLLRHLRILIMITTSFSRAPRETVWRQRQFDGIADPPGILIADDHLETAAATGLALGAEGFLTRSAGTGIDTIRLVRSWKPHALLLDLSMPLGSGWDVADALRGAGNECLLVAYTAFSTESDLRRSERAGFDAYFVKPCDPNRLMRVLFDYLNWTDR